MRPWSLRERFLNLKILFLWWIKTCDPLKGNFGLKVREFIKEIFFLEFIIINYENHDGFNIKDDIGL